MHISELLDKRSVQLNVKVKNKEEAINVIVDLIAKSDCLNDLERFRAAVFDRERQGSTGFGDEIAIPHAKSAGVNRVALAAITVANEGVEFDAIDGQNVKLIFLIASPHKASEAHLDVLARLSTFLVDPTFKENLLKANTYEDFIALFNAAEEKEDQEKENQAKEDTKNNNESFKVKYDLVAVTACPAGLSHTYMAAEALELKAKEMGISIKVEADGAAGNRNRLMPDDIANAKAVIVAADRAVEMDRFIGKRMVRAGVVQGARNPQKLIEKALDPKCPIYNAGTLSEASSIPMKMYRHLMSGLTYLLPLAATAGILSSIARLSFVQDSNIGLFLDSISYSLGTLLFPVLSAFIAFSIAGSMGLVAGFTGGIMADMASAGVIGAVVNGFSGGGFAFLLAKFAERFLKGHDAMFALLVYPLVSALGATLISNYITNLPCFYLDNLITTSIDSAPLYVLTIIGAILAGMMSADMGGPFNKVAYAVGVLMLANCLPNNGVGSLLMGAVMSGGMIPPLAASISCFIFEKSRFTKKERDLAKETFIKGLLFITEGVIPYLKVSPTKMRLACILGSATAGALSMTFHCGINAPHGGIFVAFLAQNQLFYFLSLLAGAFVGAFFFTILRPSLGTSFNHKKLAR